MAKTVVPGATLVMQLCRNEEGDTVLGIQETHKQIKLYDLRSLIESSSKSKACLATFSEPSSNTILDYQLLADWRRATEELEGETLPAATVFATLTLE